MSSNLLSYFLIDLSMIDILLSSFSKESKIEIKLFFVDAKIGF